MKFICGPMATISHEAFRRCVEAFGFCDEYFTEMINASSLLNMGPFEKFYLMNGTVEDKIVWQLTGWDGVTMGKAASFLCTQGGLGIDINMGCSAPPIYKLGAGIGWMLKPISETAQCVREVKKAILEHEKSTGEHLRLSVKCRLGKDDFKDNDFFSFTDMLVSEGVELITLHARTIREKPRTYPRYTYVQELCSRYKNIDVYLNGFVKDKASYEYARKMAPDAKGMMIATQAAVEPWIFRKLSNIELNDNSNRITVDRKLVAHKFLEDMVECQPEEFWKTRVQRFFSYYCKQFEFAHYFGSKMMNYFGMEDSHNKIDSYFDEMPGEQFIEI